tara:strand:+ start:768 stop:1247 length:480 start_codon:yes stop_codon:yes gene_type:complete
MFRLNKKIKEKCIQNNFLGKEINKIECEVQNRLNEIGLSNKSCSYQFILNKFSVKIIVCSKRNVDENMINYLKEDYYKKYGLSNLESVISWGNFNKKWDEILYKLILFEVQYNWKKVEFENDKNDNEYVNMFFDNIQKEVENVELFRDLNNWVGFEKVY